MDTPDTPPTQRPPVRIVQTDEGPRAQVTISADDIVRQLSPEVREAAVAAARAEALEAALLVQVLEPEPAAPAGPSEEEQAAALMAASRSALAEALTEAEVNYGQRATKKDLALLCAQHGVVPG